MREREFIHLSIIVHFYVYAGGCDVGIGKGCYLFSATIWGSIETEYEKRKKIPINFKKIRFFLLTAVWFPVISDANLIFFELFHLLLVYAVNIVLLLNAIRLNRSE